MRGIFINLSKLCYHPKIGYYLNFNSLTISIAFDVLWIIFFLQRLSALVTNV